MATKAANPAAVSIKAAGIPISGGWGDGDFLSIEQVSDTVTDVVGTGGEVAISNSMDARADVKLTLMETSDENQALMQLYNLMKRSNGTTGVFPFEYHDTDTGETCISTDAYIKRAPSITKGREAKMREWQIRLCQAEFGRVG